MIDLDRFKSINDAFGHTAGDRPLKSLGRLLRQRLRRSDVLGRYGGDELAVLLPHTDGPTARRVLDKIRDSFSQLRLAAGGREMSATLSCGVAVYPACPNAAALVEAADAALYEAKGGGRNRIVLRD
jgi:diguanylate cyclase (GGDEF)-like protein